MHEVINSAIVVGLYYGFLTTFSIGPSYLFLLRAQVMEEREEGIINNWFYYRMAHDVHIDPYSPNIINKPYKI